MSAESCALKERNAKKKKKVKVLEQVTTCITPAFRRVSLETNKKHETDKQNTMLMKECEVSFSSAF